MHNSCGPWLWMGSLLVWKVKSTVRKNEAALNCCDWRYKKACNYLFCIFVREELTVFGFVRADYEKNFENHWPNLYAGAYRGQMSPGARNKSGAPPHVCTWVLSEANVPYWRSLVTFWGLFGAPIVSPGGYVLLAPSLRPCLYGSP